MDRKRKRKKLEIYFKTKNFLIISLDDIKLYHVHLFKTSKEMWYTLEMIYGVSPSIEQKKMNTQGKEDEDTHILDVFQILEILEIVSLKNI